MLHPWTDGIMNNWDGRLRVGEISPETVNLAVFSPVYTLAGRVLTVKG